jgi:predicted ribosomally synthesized peptide with SipW-like signal peptide
MKRLLVATALVATVLSAGGARAYFTAQTEIKDNVITAGTVALTVEPAEAALTVGPVAPGETITRTVDVKNTGVLGFDAVTTVAKKAGYTDLWNALACRVTCDGTQVYDGPLATMRTLPIRVAPGQTARVTYAIGLPAEAGNDLQGDYVRASLYVDVEQAH